MSIEPQPAMIFRPSAVRRYMQWQDTAVYPKLSSSHTFIYLWFLVGLLLLSGVMLSWFGELPIYASGVVTIVERKARLDGSASDLTLLVWLPSKEFAHLRPGR